MSENKIPTNTFELDKKDATSATANKSSTPEENKNSAVTNNDTKKDTPCIDIDSNNKTSKDIDKNNKTSKDIILDKDNNAAVDKKSPFLSSKPIKLNEDTNLGENSIESRFKENILFKSKCSLFWISPKTKKLEDRAKGKLYVIFDSNNVRRILVIRDKLCNKACFHVIPPNSQLVPAKFVSNSWIWIAFNDNSDDEEKYPKLTFFCTFDSKDNFDNFESIYKESSIENKRILSKMGNE